jgi:hypothetical protein
MAFSARNGCQIEGLPSHRGPANLLAFAIRLPSFCAGFDGTFEVRV